MPLDVITESLKTVYEEIKIIFHAQKRPPIGLTGGLKCNFTMLLLYAEIRLG